MYTSSRKALILIERARFAPIPTAIETSPFNDPVWTPQLCVGFIFCFNRQRNNCKTLHSNQLQVTLGHLPSYLKATSNRQTT